MELTIIWVGFLGLHFEVRGGKITPCLKLVRIMLEASKLARKYTPIFSFRKYTFQCLGPLNFADVSIFWQKNSVFCPKKYLHSKQYCESYLRDFLVLFSVFVSKKVTIAEKIIFEDSASGMHPLDCSKLVKNSKHDNDVTFLTCRHRQHFLMWFCLSCQVQLLVQFSCQYHHWFRNYNNFLLRGIDQKYGNRKHPSLSQNRILEQNGIEQNVEYY